MEIIVLFQQYLVIKGDTWYYFKTYDKARKFILEMEVSYKEAS